MATIRTTCPHCGDVKTKSSAVLLRICEDDDTGACLIRCPRCGARFTKETDDHLIGVLTAAGVPIEYWRLPLELRERPRFSTPLSHDDLIDLHDLLADDQAFLDAIASG